MAVPSDLPVEIWSMIIQQVIRSLKHKFLHGLALIFHGALGQKTAAKAKAGFGLLEKQLFRTEWAQDHSDHYDEAHARARMLAVVGQIREIQTNILAHPGGPNDPAVIELHEEEIALFLELALHQTYLDGTGPPPPRPVDGCQPQFLLYPPGPRKRHALGKIFQRCCIDCLALVFCEDGHPLEVGRYDERGMSYFAMAALAPDNELKDQMLVAMVHNADLIELSTLHQIVVHDPDNDQKRVNIVHLIGHWRAVRDAWIDRMHAFTTAFPGTINAPVFTQQCKGSHYWLRHLSFYQYRRAHEIGLRFDDVPGAENGVSSAFYEVLDGPQTNYSNQILTHMCAQSMNSINSRIFPARFGLVMPAVNGFPNLLNGSQVCAWFMAIWRNQRANATLLANARWIDPLTENLIRDGYGAVGLLPPRKPNRPCLIGYAAIQHMNAGGVAMLLEWIEIARPNLSRTRDLHAQVVELMNDVLDQYARMHLEIYNRYAAMVAPGAPPLPPGINLHQAEIAEVTALQGHAQAMLDILLDRSVHFQTQLELTSQFHNMTIVDTPGFRDFMTHIVEPRQRSRQLESRVQRPLLSRLINRGSRLTRSGRRM